MPAWKSLNKQHSNIAFINNSQGISQEAGGRKDIGQGSVDTVLSIVQVLHNPENDLL